MLVPTHRPHQESGEPLTDSSPSHSDLTQQLSLAGSGAPRPLPTLSRSCESMATSGKAAYSPTHASNTKDAQELPSHKDSPSEVSLGLGGNRSELPPEPTLRSSCREKEESELHLYVLSATSSIFLHLKSSWTNYIIVSDRPAGPHLSVFAWFCCGFLFGCVFWANMRSPSLHFGYLALEIYDCYER